ncbi:hypothetical protein K7W42_05480 [Deinococcus sp. HMF7604]|uniref:hypothetical protein n=1 Tax=Deinococcus betulae TaxID=2873312 RepID=UPI001CCF268E|nr:hypothetical protein [Deinococcus betulae]MBZ9750313.1 hypothetical protein [Deinococcus betulae]
MTPRVTRLDSQHQQQGWRLWRWTLRFGVLGVLLVVLPMLTVGRSGQVVAFGVMYATRLALVVLYGALLVVTGRRWRWLSLPLILLPEILPFGLISLAGLLMGLAEVRRHLKVTGPDSRCQFH